MLGTKPAIFADVDHRATNAALSANVSTGFTVLSTKGRRFTLIRDGEEDVIQDQTKGGRMVDAASVEVVMVGASPYLAKSYYEKAYDPGTVDVAPDCWSLDGHTPDISVAHKQSPYCVGCPKNAWGSKISQLGSAVKACGDSRRLVVFLLSELLDAQGPDPIMIRMPPTGLPLLRDFQRELEKVNAPTFAVVADVSFSSDKDYPLPVFKAVRWVTDAEGAVIKPFVADEAGRDRIDGILYGRPHAEVLRSIAAPAPTPALAGPRPQLAVVQAPPPVPADVPVPTGGNHEDEASPPRPSQAPPRRRGVQAPAPKPTPAPTPEPEPQPAPLPAAAAAPVPAPEPEVNLDTMNADQLRALLAKQMGSLTTATPKPAPAPMPVAPNKAAVEIDGLDAGATTSDLAKQFDDIIQGG
jgi:hypothetical protein